MSATAATKNLVPAPLVLGPMPLVALLANIRRTVQQLNHN